MCIIIIHIYKWHHAVVCWCDIWFAVLQSARTWTTTAMTMALSSPLASTTTAETALVTWRASMFVMSARQTVFVLTSNTDFSPLHLIVPWCLHSNNTRTETDRQTDRQTDSIRIDQQNWFFTIALDCTLVFTLKQHNLHKCIKVLRVETKQRYNV